ncbi:hypothetical protein K1719_041684 [Acacia pycnantha]|nr:hypothetical protein K1719_041684 [Acacia pycnantha]
MLFMMHMLGTFSLLHQAQLPPRSAEGVSLDHQWLCPLRLGHIHCQGHPKELADYVNAIRGNNNCNSYVGGCIYMLLISCERHKITLKGRQGDGDHHDDERSGYDDDKAPGKPIEVDESDGGSPIGERGTKGEQSIVPYQLHQQYAPRRSHRPKMAKNMSPWTLTKPMKRPRKAKEEKAIFFDLISGSCTNEESEQILIQIDDEDLTREQLQTLGRRNKLSNRVMSVVCKTLMADMQKEGQSLFVTKPSSWKVAEWEHLLLPQHIGYNIGDCDLIMGPILVKEHWFCVALDPSTMSFYVLDSMNNKVYTSKKKQTAFVNPTNSDKKTSGTF